MKGQAVTQYNATSLDRPEQTSESTFLKSDLPIAEKLERARRELLDLSARNRLLNIPKNSKTSRTITIIDEKPEEVFRMLATENRAFTFLAGRASLLAKQDEDDEEIVDLAKPDESINEDGVFSRHIDTKLQTRLTQKGLQKRLLDLHLDAQTLEEEQGVNILYLALGTLKWVDLNNAKNIRNAPLILIPVRLERGNATDQFKLRWRQEDSATNLSLEVFLDRVHSLKLPQCDMNDAFSPTSYFSAVADAVRAKANWEVNPDDITLGFFSFAKFLMYVDLDPKSWPPEQNLLTQPLIRSLLTEGFEHDKTLISDDANIDDHILPVDMRHIVDCDSSQSLVVHDVRKGKNLIVQGPPGTGKSQTIANIIAAAIADGKTVLFVAEKMAALEVVKRRLDQVGVGDACLELHSNKANKRLVLDELRRTSELGSPKGIFPSTLNQRIQIARDELNAHANRLHMPHPCASLTPYQVIGQLTRLRQQDVLPNEIVLQQAEIWSPDEMHLRKDLASELGQRITESGLPESHPWHGIGITSIISTEVTRLIAQIRSLKEKVTRIINDQTALADSLRVTVPNQLRDFTNLAVMAKRISDAPSLSAKAMTAAIWDNELSGIVALLANGNTFKQQTTFLNGKVSTAAWGSDIAKLIDLFACLPPSFATSHFQAIQTLHEHLPKLIQQAQQLALELGITRSLDNLAAIKQAVTTGERVACAPNVSADVFAATVWDDGVEKAADLAEAVKNFEHDKLWLQEQVIEAAWDIDPAPIRQTLAVHGSSWLRFIRSDWRKANQLIKSLLKNPDTKLPHQIFALDRLVTAQKNRAFICQNEDFGQKAFGADWRAERSSSTPLCAIVEWMRSLRGLGAEPRLIASRLPNQSAISERIRQVHSLLETILPLVKQLRGELGSATETFSDDNLLTEQLSLTILTAEMGKLVLLGEQCANLIPNTPANAGQILTLLIELRTGQEAFNAIQQVDDIGSNAFDNQWSGHDSDWKSLADTTQWMEANNDLREIASWHDDKFQPLNTANTIESQITPLREGIEKLLSDLCSRSGKLFEVEQIEDIPLDCLLTRFALWIKHEEQLSKWVSYRDRTERARGLGMEQFVMHLETGKIDACEATQSFEMAYFEALFKDQIRLMPELAKFDGDLHSQRVQEFGNLDRERISMTSLEVTQAHHRRIPRGGSVGPLGILKGEMARKRGHMPIRQLMNKAAPVILALKPVLMMSPLSVAQFLPPGQLSFDMLVMDEASQIQPVDALGAIARCKQVVVVGDEKQLPPTRFFAKITGGGDVEDEDESAQVADIESILGLFKARGLHQRMLRWHYRSRHQSLIAISNSQFYENKLFIVPSPYTKEAGMGLQFHYIAKGVFDSGNSNTNQIEAQVVAQAIIQHAKARPHHSLGVATFSVAQRKAIQDHLELLRCANPDTEGFFAAHLSEPFFIKNLENVQGDERDVIFISVGYGRNVQGYMAMRFGPLSSVGGERRLNVLISRAKQRCEVFASITDEDIDLERGKGVGVYAFKLFLHFARTGKLGLAEASGREYDSDFERQVAAALENRGYQVHPQVGIAGFFIDLAIADPERPGRYLLGIECDGATYHSSRSARDRDRLRQAVLEDHGWIMHRIWSTDWFQRPQDQLDKVAQAIEAAKLELDSRLERHNTANRAVPIHITTIKRSDGTEVGLETMGNNDQDIQPYIEAHISKPDSALDLPETPLGILANLVHQVVLIEGPVHVDEVILRLRNAWGLKRAGNRIQAAVEQAINVATRNNQIVRDNNFLLTPETIIKIRNRASVQSDTLRKPEMLPFHEVDVAIRKTVKENFGAELDEIIQTVARNFGFKTTSSQLREMIQARIHILERQSTLIQQGAIFMIKTKVT